MVNGFQRQLQRARNVLRRRKQAREGRRGAPLGKDRYPFIEPKAKRKITAVGGAWPEPPDAEGRSFNWSLTPKARTRRTRYDIKLFEELNEEYRDKPLVPQARGIDPSSRFGTAQKRLTDVTRYIDVENQRVLEIGCGQGQEVWFLHHKFGSDAFGIDVKPYPEWLALRGPGVNLSMGDAAAVPFADESFDRVLSFAVWEHVPQPFTAIAETKRVLKPGGLAWLYANLHRGPSASHRYRDVYFPWPHLLFDEEVAIEFFERQGKKGKFSWVNKLTYDTYDKYFRLLDLEVVHLAFSEKPWDQEFYERFEDVLGRYPKTDLKRDFFTAILRKA